MKIRVLENFYIDESSCGSVQISHLALKKNKDYMVKDDMVVGEHNHKIPLKDVEYQSIFC
jgi:hypothetical protein